MSIDFDLQKGLTLIEIMIGLVITSMMIICLLSIYLLTEKNNEIKIALNTIEDNANLLTEIFRNEIHQAGYRGCAKLSNEENKIEIHENQLTIRHASSKYAELKRDMRSYSILYLSRNIKINKNNVYLISDCKTSDIFSASEVENSSNDIQKIISEFPLSKKYENNAEIRKMEIKTYYIVKTKRINLRGEPIYGLYVKENNDDSEELIEGIESMKIYQEVNGILIKLTLVSLNHFFLKKEWYIYAACYN